MTNPWDSLMICGFSWNEAMILVRVYAKKQGRRVTGTGKVGKMRRDKRL